MSKYSEANTVRYYDVIYRKWISDSYTNSELHLIKRYLKKGGKILDIGCGSGRHAIPLTKEGYDVTGIEPLKEFVKIIKSKSPRLRVHRCFFKDFKTQEKFDVIISMWNAFHQLALTDSEAINVLSKMKGLLKEKGVIILSLSPGEEFDINDYNFEHEEYEKGKRYHLDWKVKKYEPKTKTVHSLETITVYDRKDKIVDKQQALVVQRYWCESDLKKFAKKLSLKLDILPPFEEGRDRYYLFRSL